jgi:hypothetical protein
MLPDGWVRLPSEQAFTEPPQKPALLAAVLEYLIPGLGAWFIGSRFAAISWFILLVRVVRVVWTHAFSHKLISNMYVAIV